jgi:3-oxoacyl-[acyl-carrier-protein] synthase II
MSKRVVITGMGVVHSLGCDLDTFWQAIKSGRNGISTVTRFDVADFPTKVAAEIRDFDSSAVIDRKDAKRMDRFAQYAVVAAAQAVAQSGIDFETMDPYRAGVIIGSGIGGMDTLEENSRVLLEKGVKRVSPFFAPMMIANMASGQVAIHFGIRGYNACVVTACASANHAIGDAFRTIQAGHADVMITGGAEAAISGLGFAGFCASRAMTFNPDPETACRPFDKGHDGFVMGEGAGVLMLEAYDHAVARGANILGELVGYGCTCDAYHMTAPQPDGEAGAKCMELAIADAGISVQDIGYVNAHGTSTPVGDPIEVMVARRVFGEHVMNVPMSSTKSMTGHLLGAAGGIEAVITMMAIRDSFLPPTIHLEEPDEGCDLDFVANVGRSKELTWALSNSLGFGGHNGAIVLKKFTGA